MFLRLAMEYVMIKTIKSRLTLMDSKPAFQKGVLMIMVMVGSCAETFVYPRIPYVLVVICSPLTIPNIFVVSLRMEIAHIIEILELAVLVVKLFTNHNPAMVSAKKVLAQHNLLLTATLNVISLTIVTTAGDICVETYVIMDTRYF